MILTGDALQILPTLDAASVQCVVTSPPYWGLRDYGTATWKGGDPGCNHKQGRNGSGRANGIVDERGQRNRDGVGSMGGDCSKCGAIRIDSQIGLEPTPEAYVEKLVQVFREIKRVLRDDGTVWLNLGDSYMASGQRQTGRNDTNRETPGGRGGSFRGGARRAVSCGKSYIIPDLKPKDLIGIPWLVAFALQADGWVLRQEIIWEKPNPMPESVRDRCTKAHEQIFLFAKARWVGPDRGIFANLSDSDARWLALFIDTEGNICVKRTMREDTGRTQYGIQATFANTNRSLLETAQRIVGVGSIHERTGKNANMFYWQITGQQVRDFLYKIYPHLIVKQRQAALGIYVCDVLNQNGKKRPGGFRDPEHTKFLETAWIRMKSLNHFGNPDLSDVPPPACGHWDSARYFYDAEAVKEGAAQSSLLRWNQNIEDQEGSYRVPGKTNGPMKAVGGSRSARDSIKRENSKRAEVFPGQSMGTHRPDREESAWDLTTRNRRSVWTITTKPFKEAHFATFPPEIPEICIKAGTSKKGCCPECGSPWERILQRGNLVSVDGTNETYRPTKATNDPKIKGRSEGWVPNHFRELFTTGWRPTCAHNLKPIPCTVMDPFSGAGTTGIVAEKLGRKYIGIELKLEYVEMSEKRRLDELGGLFA